MGQAGHSSTTHWILLHSTLNTTAHFSRIGWNRSQPTFLLSGTVTAPPVSAHVHSYFWRGFLFPRRSLTNSWQQPTATLSSGLRMHLYDRDSLCGSDSHRCKWTFCRDRSLLAFYCLPSSVKGRAYFSYLSSLPPAQTCKYSILWLRFALQ